MSDNSKIPNCPCCDNPWSRAIAGTFLCNTCDDEDDASAKPTASPPLDPLNMDTAASPSDDFYQYANGGWMAKNPIPAGYSRWSSFSALMVQSQERLRDLLSELASGEGKEELTEEEEKLKAFYEAALDGETIEALGLEPLEPLLEACKTAAEEPDAIARSLGLLHRSYGLSPFFSLGASPDAKNSKWTIPQVAQGGLGMPDRDYYFDEDKADKREAYKEHMVGMFILLGMEREEAESASETVYALEESLAGAHMTKTECRDPEALYNKMTIARLSETIGKDQFDFSLYLQTATNKSVEELGEINVCNTEAISKVADILKDIDGSALRCYLLWNVVRVFAPYLPEAFVKEHFNFFEKNLQGTEEMKPRWKRAMQFTESSLGEALGKMYCKRYFNEESKTHALKIIENVRVALEEKLKEVDWITSEETRNAALKKMDKFKVKIGYPDEWIDYTPLKIHKESSFLNMIFLSRSFDELRESKEMNAPTDADKWFLTPQTINAYYHPLLNEIVFPAAILQPPMFDINADDAMNYGAMGAVIGHEMTHGFDDQGSKFNFEGNMINWWTDQDTKEYQRRVDVMVDQANEFEVHGQKVKGQLTCGENIADLGGINLAYRALLSTPDFSSTDLIDGFTPSQRFFLSWAQCWRGNITKEQALQFLTLDPHGPMMMRCNGPLSNVEQFHEAFGIEEGAPMYRPKESRVDIW